MIAVDPFSIFFWLIRGICGLKMVLMLSCQGRIGVSFRDPPTGFNVDPQLPMMTRKILLTGPLKTERKSNTFILNRLGLYLRLGTAVTVENAPDHKSISIHGDNRQKGDETMKEISELDLPGNIRYAEDHEWARPEDDKVRVGIDDYAQDQLGDIVFVELPQVGETFRKGEEFGTVESVKAVAELCIPVSGEILSVNAELEESPELVNKEPYGGGWMIDVKADNPAELESLMTKDVYIERLKGTK